MKNKQKKCNITQNAKIMLLSTTSYGFESLKNNLDADISNLELSVLYRNKIYDEEDSKYVREMFNELALSVDTLINEHKKKIFVSFDRLMRNFTKYNSAENQNVSQIYDKKNEV